MTPAVPLPIVEKLASALRVMPCRCTRGYDMKVTKQCGRCHALAAFDQWSSIVQTPGVKPGEGEGK